MKRVYHHIMQFLYIVMYGWLVDRLEYQFLIKNNKYRTFLIPSLKIKLINSKIKSNSY